MAALLVHVTLDGLDFDVILVIPFIMPRTYINYIFGILFKENVKNKCIELKYAVLNVNSYLQHIFSKRV